MTVAPGLLGTLVLMGALCSVSVRDQGPLRASVYGALGSLLIGCSVVAHELAHWWTARRLAVPVHQIDFTAGLSGSVRRDPAPDRSGHALICLAGPAVNLALLGIGLALARIEGFVGSTGALLALVNAAALGPSLLPLKAGDLRRAATWRPPEPRSREPLDPRPSM